MGDQPGDRGGFADASQRPVDPVEALLDALEDVRNEDEVRAAVEVAFDQAERRGAEDAIRLVIGRLRGTKAARELRLALLGYPVTEADARQAGVSRQTMSAGVKRLRKRLLQPVDAQRVTR